MSATDYERYIRTDELLSLQPSEAELAHPDELLFQATHQAAEIWMKQMLFDLRRTCREMEAGDAEAAAMLLGRMSRVWALLAESVEVLETMSPADYHVVRTRSLGRGSGQQSPGFNRLLDAAPELWTAYAALLARRAATVLEVQRDPRRWPDLYRLTQGMMEWDERFQKWRSVHYALVRRIIGAHVLSLQGVPAKALERYGVEAFFPELWKVIEQLTNEYKPTY